MTALTPAPPYRNSFCAECYTAAIERLCSGYTITYSTGKTVIAIPPLPPGAAARVRQSAEKHIEKHGQASTRQHSQHIRQGG